MNPLCIYHADCMDGVMAAAIVSEALNGEVATYPGRYTANPPTINAGQKVILVDFSYPRDALIAIAKVASDVLVIDHHKTAMEDLRDLPENIHVVLDASKCGAMLAWEIFFEDTKPPIVIEYIQDRDLWENKLVNTHQIIAWLSSFPLTVPFYRTLITQERTIETHREMISAVADGNVILRYKEKLVRSILTNSVARGSINGVDVPMANVPHELASDAGHILCKGERFSMTYYIQGDYVIASLRSDENGDDVSEVAKSLGGGGHRHAAGFHLDSRNLEIPE